LILQQIKATVGPSVTLYEIVPEAGIRISKIKSLEDDMRFLPAALEFVSSPYSRKGTIGIEVPNVEST
jgi:S-DNA-T family DNA segregation ATPase FtsK/SpoIIIE